MPAGAGRQLDGRKEMGEDASWSLELVDRFTAVCSRERRDSWEESREFTHRGSVLAGKVLAYVLYVTSLTV